MVLIEQSGLVLVFQEVLEFAGDVVGGDAFLLVVGFALGGVSGGDELCHFLEDVSTFLDQTGDFLEFKDEEESVVDVLEGRPVGFVVLWM